MRKHLNLSLLPLLFAALLAFAPACSGGDTTGGTGGGDLADGDSSSTGGGDVGTTDGEAPDDDDASPVDEDAGHDDGGGTDPVGDGGGTDPVGDGGETDPVGDGGETDPVVDVIDDPEPAVNACTNPGDMEVLEAAFELMISQCSLPCLADEDPGACFGACAVAAGFTPDCSGCYEAFGACVAEICPEACTPETAQDDACGACAGPICSTDFYTCSGLNLFGGDGPEPGLGLCANPEDAALLNAPSDPGGTCWSSCQADDDPGTCVTECLAGFGFSGDCSDCVGGFGDCVAESCAEVCSPEDAGEDGDACDSCIGTLCGAAWAACFEGMEGGGSAPGECVNPEDSSLMEQGAGEDCFDLCIEEPDATQCVVGCHLGDGLSGPCADCNGELAGCLVDNCPDPAVCTEEGAAADDFEACLACLFGPCAEEFATCYNEPNSQPEPGPGGGVCQQGEDGEILAQEDDPAGQCWGMCAGTDDTEDCLFDCLTEAGFSDECSDCVGTFGSCTAANCPDACSPEAQAADGGEACGECIQADCGPDWLACFAEEQELEPGICALGPQNIEALAAPGDAIGYCYLICQTADATCMTECMLSNGFTGECSDCAGEFVGCVTDNCGDACSAEGQEADDGEACGECMGPACGGLWAECFAGVDQIEEDQGLCTNPEDQAAQAAGGDDAGVGACWIECLDVPDADGCVTACMQEDGFSDACSDCSGAYVGCIVDNCDDECSPETQLGDDGEACGQCVGAACFIESTACYYADKQDPEPPPEPGICALGPQNIEALAAPGDAVWYCYLICQTADDACMIDCMLSNGFTEECSECAGEFVGCVADNCGDACSAEGQEADDGEACGECLGPACGGLGAECFAGVDQIEEDQGLCTNPEDQAAQAAGGDGAGVGACWGECLDVPDADGCIAACMLEDGFSEACSDCAVAYVGCIMDHCEDECFADDDEACGECVGAACFMEYNVCYYADEQEPEPEPIEEAACGGPDDVALLTSPDGNAWECGWVCIEEPGPGPCMSDCTSEMGYSEGCAFCFGFAAECIADNCPDVCTEAGQMADGAAACTECQQGPCSEVWATCFPQ